MFREGRGLFGLADWLALGVVDGYWPLFVVRADTLDPLPFHPGVHRLFAFL